MMWHPIATAPTDGTTVDLWVDTGDGAGYLVSDARWDKRADPPRWRYTPIDLRLPSDDAVRLGGFASCWALPRDLPPEDMRAEFGFAYVETWPDETLADALRLLEEAEDDRSIELKEAISLALAARLLVSA